MAGSGRVGNRPRSNRGGFTGAGKRRCREMAGCEEARFYLDTRGVRSLDGNNDGVPCETLCR